MTAAQAAMPGPMRAVLRWLGTILLFLAAGLCFAPTVDPALPRPHLLSRAGQRPFRRRALLQSRPAPVRRRGPRRFLQPLGRPSERATWPRQVPVRPTVPPRRVEGEEMLVTWIGHATVLVQTAGPQHPHRPDLVGPRLAFLLRRPEPGARAGRALRGSAAGSTSSSSATIITTIWTCRRCAGCGSATGR